MVKPKKSIKKLPLIPRDIRRKVSRMGAGTHMEEIIPRTDLSKLDTKSLPLGLRVKGKLSAKRTEAPDNMPRTDLSKLDTKRLKRLLKEE